MLHYMASVLNARGVFGMKAYPTGLGSVPFLVPLYSAENARLLALIEADWLGQLRTGAASGVATQYMARKDAVTLGMFGTGGQAKTQMLAICAAHPIERVHVYSRSAENRAAFLAEMQPQVRAQLIAVDDPRAAVEGMGVIATMTTASQPVFDGAWLEPGTHINAAGGNHLKRREVDATTVRRANCIAADSVEQAKLECGDLVSAIAEGATTWDNVAEFSDIVAGRVPGRATADDITLFESQGISVWDIATAARVYEIAVARGVGQSIPLFD
jgi:ornithine cyclodeaminase/alanine dehydrogenase-like protein (mu-crystallin family)